MVDYLGENITLASLVHRTEYIFSNESFEIMSLTAFNFLYHNKNRVALLGYMGSPVLITYFYTDM